MVQNGTIVQTHTVQLESKIEETDEDVLSFAIINLRETFNSLANEIVVPFLLEYPDKNIVITVPKAGDKKKLLDLSLKNVDYYKEEIKRKKILHIENKTETDLLKILLEIKKYLQLTAIPTHIECFDNSNFQGSYPVSAMVCFRNGTPSKKDYRHFNVKTIKGINDFATMKEVVYRRYKRLIDENQSLPQLVIIDGGKGQLSAAMESIKELGLTGKLTLIGLAKNEEEIFFIKDSSSVKLPWNSDSLKLIRKIRDEVHRFGISFHRNQRSKGTFTNELEMIEGISKKIANQLLQNFKSVKKISSVKKEELEKIIGKAKAQIVWNHFNKK